MLDPAELDFGFTDASAFEDLESGEQMPVVPEAFREEYRALVQAHIDALTAKAAERASTTACSTPRSRSTTRCSTICRSANADPDPGSGSMAFLLPLFLAGLAALAIPVLIHLIQREKKQIVAFPSLMFVRRIPVPVGAPPQDPHWLLLLLRLAALALIVAAFARPFFARRRRRRRGRRRARGRRPARPLLQHGLRRPLEAGAGRGARGDRRRSAAADRATLVLFATGAEVALQSIDDRARLDRGDRRRQARRRGHALRPALKVAGSILAESTLPRSEVVLISDFQRSGWRGEEGTRLPAGTTLTPVSVGRRRRRRTSSVTPVSLRARRFEDQERVASPPA